jgi:flagellar biosynthesis component FlhA
LTQNSPELSPPKRITTKPPLKMSYGTNADPTIDSYMLVQLLLCIGLPMFILPLLAAAAYFAFKWLKARRAKAAGKDVEQGNSVETTTREKDEEESDEAEPRNVLMKTLVLVSNSVQVPVGFSRNFERRL